MTHVCNVNMSHGVSHLPDLHDDCDDDNCFPTEFAAKFIGLQLHVLSLHITSQVPTKGSFIWVDGDKFPRKLACNIPIHCRVYPQCRCCNMYSLEHACNVPSAVSSYIEICCLIILVGHVEFGWRETLDNTGLAFVISCNVSNEGCCDVSMFSSSSH